jgi:hypothetical protein
VSGRSRAESQVGVRLMGVWHVSYSNIQEFFLYSGWRLGARRARGICCEVVVVAASAAPRRRRRDARQQSVTTTSGAASQRALASHIAIYEKLYGVPDAGTSYIHMIRAT